METNRREIKRKKDRESIACETGKVIRTQRLRVKER